LYRVFLRTEQEFFEKYRLALGNTLELYWAFIHLIESVFNEVNF
jgi:hypothetical protein